jgi:hypothetical protein
VLALGLSGCAASEQPAATITHGIVVQSEPTEVFLTAEIAGEITTVGGVCWALAADEETSIIVFPSTTEVDATSTEVTIPGVGTWQQGDQFEWGGGRFEDAATSPAGAILPSECSGYGVVVVNPAEQ